MSSWPSINLGPLAHPGYHGLGECVSATQGFGRLLSSLQQWMWNNRKDNKSHQSRKIFSQMFVDFSKLLGVWGCYDLTFHPRGPPFLWQSDLYISSSDKFLEILPGCRSVEIISKKTGCQDMFFFVVGVGILYNHAEPLDIFLGPCCEVFKGCCHMAVRRQRADLRKRVVCTSAKWN